MAAQVITVPGAWDGPALNKDLDNEQFWDGLLDHRLLLWHCDKCDAWYWPRAYCRNHEVGAFMEGMSWQESSGRGQIHSVNVHHVAFNPVFTVPYTYAVVELDEGPLISSTIIGLADGQAAKVGDLTEIVYEDHPDAGFTLPRFRLI